MGEEKRTSVFNELVKQRCLLKVRPKRALVTWERVQKGVSIKDNIAPAEGEEVINNSGKLRHKPGERLFRPTVVFTDGRGFDLLELLGKNVEAVEEKRVEVLLHRLDARRFDRRSVDVEDNNLVRDVCDEVWMGPDDEGEGALEDLCHGR